MNHLNEDILIQYAFDLLDNEQQKDTAAHLEQCADCRVQLEQIQKQFAALDVLKENAVLSEELIQQTLKKVAVGKTVPFFRKVWVEWTAAAAAVILICVLLLQNLPDTEVKTPAPAGFDKPLAKSDTSIDQPERSLPGHSERSEESPLMDTETLHFVQGDKLALGGMIDNVKFVSADVIPDVAPVCSRQRHRIGHPAQSRQIQLTIYNSADLTLVRDTRRLTLKPGWNWLQFMWDGTLIDPTSLSLRPLQHADKIDIQQLVYPARLKDIGRWLIRSEVEGSVPFEITYFASGLSWRAFYMGTMNADETTMNLKGYVNVANNSGQNFENAQTRLVVGETHLLEEIPYLAQRRYPYGPDTPELFNGEDGDSKSNWYHWQRSRSRLSLGDMTVTEELISDDRAAASAAMLTSLRKLKRRASANTSSTPSKAPKTSPIPGLNACRALMWMIFPSRASINMMKTATGAKPFGLSHSRTMSNTNWAQRRFPEVMSSSTVTSTPHRTWLTSAKAASNTSPLTKISN